MTKDPARHCWLIPEKNKQLRKQPQPSVLDGQILSFLIWNSVRPSIEAGIKQLQGHVEPEKWRKSHCPICGCLPSLSMLEGEEEKGIPFVPGAVLVED